MGKVYILDCTLRDGGYINDWDFGEKNIRGFSRKIAQTGIEIYEVGFIRGNTYDPDKSIFPDTESFKNVIQPKADGMLYVGMLDLNNPVPIERISPYDGKSIDGIRVIFKKDKIIQAYEYCKKIQELGYFVSVNFVGTDLYTDKEFIEGIEKFNKLNPFAVSIVDSFGVIKRKQFLRLVYLADNNLAPGIALAYHSHNNLQQALGNAETLVEMNLKRDIVIDACVFGMGRGAGNLNLELFAEYMNENYDTNYKIEPMLEIIDEYLNDIYKTKFWGYSLPLYLSASIGCHPDYAIYFAEKKTLTVKAFSELLMEVPKQEKIKFNTETAEKYYCRYQKNYIDDRSTVAQLKNEFTGKDIIMLAPGSSLSKYSNKITNECKKKNTVVISVNFCADKFSPDYIFSSNAGRYIKIRDDINVGRIITSNIHVRKDKAAYVVNFSSYASQNSEITDNSGLMLLRLLAAAGIREVKIAGMDGYSLYKNNDYYDERLEFDFSRQAEKRNALISAEISQISKMLRLDFITPTCYNFC